MTIEIEQFASLLKPDRTILFLGAGASVPSGAPAGMQLSSELWSKLAQEPPVSSDFTEVCSILENRYGRPKLVETVRAILGRIQPTGGLLSLPEFDWASIYTTNYDCLIETAYNRCKREIVIIRSNFDYDKCTSSQSVKLYKVHGCLKQDSVDGHQSRMILSERDNDEYIDFREAMFRSLDHDMVTKDTLIIGYSLADGHIRQYMQKIAELHSKKGTPGRLFALMYNKDQDRAALWERRGFTVCFGGIDDLMFSLGKTKPLTHRLAITSGEGLYQLPSQLRPCTIDARHALGLSPNHVRLFNGGPASYADIKNEITFRRSTEHKLSEKLNAASINYLTITGAAGVGKTTLARRLLLTIATNPDPHQLVWESKTDFPWRADDWREVEQQLRDSGQKGILLVDDCSTHLRQINILAEQFSRIEQPALKLVLTADTASWLPRTKSPELFGRGHIEKISRLSSEEIEELVNLIERQGTIRSLVDHQFASLNRNEQIRRLHKKCSADMFVCLKNIFGTEELDTILLRDYASLSEPLQDIYRHVAALEAAGTRVHRQLIIRILGIPALQISSLLSQTDGLVEEYDIDPSNGLYGWSTRHEVVARLIAKYKFSDQAELFTLLERVIQGLNPTIPIELRTLRDICSSDYGITRLSNTAKQTELLEKLIQLAPGERVPRHRLVRLLIFTEQFDLATQAIRDAEEKTGMDPVICRYRIKLAIHRAENTQGILPEDRRAILRDAESIALNAIRRFHLDKYTYMAYIDVGVAYAELSRDTTILNEAIQIAREAADKILDPQLGEMINSAEGNRRRLERQGRE